MMQVLLVDDSPAMRHYVARTLRMTGMEFQIHEAENGREAMSKAMDVRPDLVITDLNMPEMGGEQLVAEMHKLPELKATPVIVMSAVRSPGKSQELIHAGAVAYMTKPVSPEALGRLLVSILEARG
jgi:two-component system, chemotaxis family, chemotaxis protein CheY